MLKYINGSILYQHKWVHISGFTEMGSQKLVHKNEWFLIQAANMNLV